MRVLDHRSHGIAYLVGTPLIGFESLDRPSRWADAHQNRLARSGLLPLFAQDQQILR